MNFLFSADGVVLSFLNKVLNILLLGILWLIFSLPIITIGASTTAFYSVLFKISKGSEGYISKQFFEAFRKDFKQSTVVFLINSVVFILLYLDFYICLNFFNSTIQIMSFVVFSIVTFIYYTLSCYLYPVQAKFSNSTKKLFSNCFKLAFSNIVFSINIIFFSILHILILYLLKDTFILTSLFYTFIVYVTSAFIKTLLFSNRFKKLSLEE